VKIGSELIGWPAAAILFLRLSRQVYAQWRDGKSPGCLALAVRQAMRGISWFCVPFLAAGQWVFVITNAPILVTPVVGEFIYLRNRRGAGKSGA
jgi:hypothetical protein